MEVPKNPSPPASHGSHRANLNVTKEIEETEDARDASTTELEMLRLTNARLGAELATARSEAAGARAEAAIARLGAASAKADATTRVAEMAAELAVERTACVNLKEQLASMAPTLGLLTPADLAKLSERQGARLDDGLWAIVERMVAGCGGNDYDAELRSTRNLFASVGLVLREPDWHGGNDGKIQEHYASVVNQNSGMVDRMRAKYYEFLCWTSKQTGERHSLFSNLILETVFKVSVYRGVISESDSKQTPAVS